MAGESLFRKTSDIFRTIQETIEGIGEDGLPIPKLEETLNEIKRLTREEVKTSVDVFTHIAAEQMETYINKLIKDRFAPVTAIVLYLTYQELIELIHEPKGVKETLTQLVHLLDRYKIDPDWCLYEQTLLLIDAINEISPFLPQSNQLRELVTTVSNWRNSTPCVLPLKITPTELLSPYGIKDTHTFERHILSLWRLLERAREKAKTKLHTVVPEVFSDPDTFLQYIEILLKYIHDFCAHELKLPIMETPIQLRVVYGEESKFTDAVAYFYRQGDTRYVAIHLPTGQKEIYLSEYAHLLIHEGIPGHATCDYLLSLLPTLKPIDYATSLDIASPFTFVDCSTIFHEGWAVTSQYLVSKNLRQSFPALWFSWFHELYLYVTRVLQVLGYLKRTPREMIRGLKPFQLSSYFIGFVTFKTMYDIDPKGVIKSVMGGVFPAPPHIYNTPQLERKIINTITQLIDEVSNFLREE